MSIRMTTPARYVLIGAMLLLSTFARCVVAQTTTTTTSDTNSRTLHIMDCPISATSVNECNIANFTYRLVMWATPGLFLGLFLLLCCPFYCGGKYCCNCCGGRNQTPNYCCPARKFPARYSKSDILRPRISLVLAFLMMGGGGVWGYMAGADPVSTNLTALKNAIVAVPAVLTAKASQIETSFTVTRVDADTEVESLSNLYSNSSVKTTTDNAKSSIESLITTALSGVDQYLAYISIALIVLCFAPAGLALLTLVCAAASLRKFLPMLSMWTAFLLAVIVWVCQGGLSTASVAVDYVCLEVTGMQALKASVLPAVVQCSESSFVTALDSYRQLEAEQATKSCNSLKGLCYNTSLTLLENTAATQAFDCSTFTDDCALISFPTLLTRYRAMKIHRIVAADDPSMAAGFGCNDAALSRTACSITDCSDGCAVTINGVKNRSTLGRRTRSANYDFAAAKQVSDSVSFLGVQYGSCTSVLSLLTAGIVAPCAVLMPGMTTLRQALAIIGGGLIMHLYCAGWGAKRFIPLKEENVPIEPDLPFEPEEEEAQSPSPVPHDDPKEATADGTRPRADE